MAKKYLLKIEFVAKASKIGNIFQRNYIHCSNNFEWETEKIQTANLKKNFFTSFTFLIFVKNRVIYKKPVMFLFSIGSNSQVFQILKAVHNRETFLTLSF